VHLVGFIIRIYHDAARSHECQIPYLTSALDGGWLVNATPWLLYPWE